MTLSLQAKIAVLSLASTGICLYSPSVNAEPFTFDFGVADVTDTAEGFSFINFENRTGSLVNDLHVSITYTTLKGQRVNMKKDFGFPDLAPGGMYTPPTIPLTDNITVGFQYTYANLRVDQENPNYDFSGTHWTKDGKKFVPGPLPILGIAAAFGFSRKLRKRIKLQKGTSDISTSAVT